MTTSQYILFDLDDTLIHCNRHFVSARVEFLGYMDEKFQGYEITEREIDQLQQEIDLAGIEQFGLGKARFPDSLVKTYLLCCEKVGRKPVPEEQLKVEQIGYSVYQQRTELLPHALEVLDKLTELKFELFVYTGGDFEVQSQKIINAGLQSFFPIDRRFITEHKNLAALEDILNTRKWPKHLVWMIGNSARSDIKPALQAGIHAIHIPDPGGWAYDQMNLSNLTTGRMFVLHSIKEVPELIARHMGNCDENCVGGC